MKAINFKLATFTFAAMLLASCSDSNSDGTSAVGSKTTVVGSAVTSITDAQELAKRVTNFKKLNTSSNARTKIATRAGSSEAEPSIPSDAKNIREVLTDSPWNQHTGNYYVDANDDVDAGQLNINIKGMNIYVKAHGTFKYSKANSYSDATHIYVLKEGKLVARTQTDGNGNCEVFNINKIDNWGTIEFPQNANNYVIKNTFNNYGNLSISGKTLDIQNDAQVSIYDGAIVAETIKLSSNNAKLGCSGDVTANTLYLTNSSSATINGITTIKDLKMDGQTTLTSGCALKVTNDVYLTNNINLYCRYFSTPNLKQDSNAKIHLADQGVLDIAGDYWNLNDGLGSTNLGDKDGVALIKCNRAIYNAPGKKLVNPDAKDWATAKKTIDCKIFTTSGDNAHIIVNFSDGVYTNNQNSVGEKVTLQNTDIDWCGGNIVPIGDEEAKNYVIKKSNCYPAGLNDDSKDPDPDPKPSLDLITTIDYDNHDHDISATGIMAHNGRMYMSYHTRGKGHGACVEVFSPVANDQVTLNQYLYDEAEDLDFNHLLAIKKKDSNERMVYLPGSSNKKGAMLAYIPILDNHLLASESKQITTIDENGEEKVTYQQPLNFIQLNPATAQYTKAGYDENCVVYNEETNHLVAMTTKGYVIYDADTYNEIDRINKSGKAKHVAIGNGKIVTLYLDREATSDEEAIPATVEVFDQKAEDLSNPLKTFSVSTIEPNNGKNVVAVKDNNIYVCRGAAGMYVYDMEGNELWHYQMPNPINKNGEYKALANGCYVGSKYVYIAYGSYGLVVLDKATHEVVAHRAVVKSANYVVEYNGYIYVAYGQSRLQVFKLQGADPETSYQE